MTQAALAKRLGVSPSAVGMYEQGRREPSYDILIALSREFDVTIDYLITGEPDKRTTIHPTDLMSKEELLAFLVTHVLAEFDVSAQ
jgi:transcriptional regulator with XRE-family HTH domain